MRGAVRRAPAEVARLVRLPLRGDAGVRGDRAVRADVGRDERRRAEGDVHVRGPRRPLADAPAGGHGAGRAGVPRRRARAGRRRSRGTTSTRDVPVRPPAGGPAPEFRQFGVEVLGVDAPGADVEVIVARRRAPARARAAATSTLEVNSIGDEMCRPAYRDALLAYLEAHRERLRDEHRDRFAREPAAGARLQGRGVPGGRRRRAHDRRPPVRRVRGALRRRSAPGSTTRASRSRSTPTLVRGLDYYTRTAFEFVSRGAVAEAQADAVRRRPVRRAGRGARRPADARGRVRHGAGPGPARAGATRAWRRAESRAAGASWWRSAPRRGRRASRSCRSSRAAGVPAEPPFEERPLKAQLKMADRAGARVRRDHRRARAGRRGPSTLRGSPTVTQETVPPARCRWLVARTTGAATMTEMRHRAAHARLRRAPRGRRRRGRSTLCGWVARRRDHGGVMFVDLRDREGIVQVVFHPEEAPEAHAAAQELRGESVVRVTGAVRRTARGHGEPDLATGEVEVAADVDRGAVRARTRRRSRSRTASRPTRSSASATATSTSAGRR